MELKYFIFPGTYRHIDSGLPLHNQLFETWWSFWSEILTQLPTPSSPHPNEFRRQDYISALFTPSNEVVGFSAHTLFNLKSLADIKSRYFTQNYDPHFVERLSSYNLNRVLSFEYLTIKSEYRNQQNGYPLAFILAGLAHRIQQDLNADAGVASCRTDLKVDGIAKKFGATELSEEGVVHGIKTKNMLTLTSNLISPAEYAPAIEQLWKNRQTLFSDSLASSERSVAAA